MGIKCNSLTLSVSSQFLEATEKSWFICWLYLPFFLLHKIQVKLLVVVVVVEVGGGTEQISANKDDLFLVIVAV